MSDYRLLVPADLVAVVTGVKAATLRVWAYRGHVGRHGKDEAGRTLYDLDEVARHAARHASVDNGHPV